VRSRLMKKAVVFQWAAKLAGLLLLLLLPAAASGEEWMGVVPGKTDKTAVRAIFGPPTREVAKKEEGYDTSEWIYDGGKAPAGATRLLVQFGLLSGGSFRGAVVRALTYFPKPNIFPRVAILDGWGTPDKTGTDPNGRVVLFYRRGFVATLDKDGRETLEMLFTVEQPE